MEATRLGHYTVMMTVLKAMRVRNWTHRNVMLYGDVIPRRIVTMDDATQFMLNAKGEAFFMRLPNGDVEPVVLGDTATPIYTRSIETPAEASAVLREWYGFS